MKYNLLKPVLTIATCLLFKTLLLAQVDTPSRYTSSTPVNYVRIWDALAPETNANTLMSRNLQDVRQTTTYIDGLGRPLQTVIKKGSLVTNPSNPTSSSAAVDLVIPVVYDHAGREPIK
jgi:hypothetical protein